MSHAGIEHSNVMTDFIKSRQRRCRKG